MKALLVLALISLISVRSNASKEVGNGGDICEDRIKIIRDDISSWINRGGAAYLNLPATIPLAEYKLRMLAKFDSAKISCTNSVLLVDKNEKTCMNYVELSATDRIVCNFNRFQSTSEADQYVLVHHEYAGLSNFETTESGDSNYQISNQLTGSLADQITKKLVVRPPSTGNCNASEIIGTYAGKFLEAYTSRKLRFPAKITIKSTGIDRSGCAIMMATFERPDLTAGAGEFLLDVKYDSHTHALQLTHYSDATSRTPQHTDLDIRGYWSPIQFSANMTWWQYSGTVQLASCTSSEVSAQGECL